MTVQTIVPTEVAIGFRVRASSIAAGNTCCKLRQNLDRLTIAVAKVDAIPGFTGASVEIQSNISIAGIEIY